MKNWIIWAQIAALVIGFVLAVAFWVAVVIVAIHFVKRFW